ncbi:MAG TPA: DUF4173 domain-containing protein [Oscillatoriaceae cyanobacterium]
MSDSAPAPLPFDPAPIANPSSARPQWGLSALGIAVALGLAGDWLLNTGWWGINWSLWLALLMGGLALQQRHFPIAGLPLWPWMTIPCLVFAGCFAWRDAPLLRMLDVLIPLFFLSVPAWRVTGNALFRVSLGAMANGLFATALDACFGAIALWRPEVLGSAQLRSGGLRRVLAVALGLAISLPILVVFGGLFASADAQFANLIRGLFRFRIDDVITHALVWVTMSWCLAGYLCGMKVRQPAAPWPEELRIRLGGIEVATVLLLVDAIFAVFVATQLPYFFGGAARVATTTGLTYANYARHGFFELVTATALVLPLLLAGHGVLRDADARAMRWYRGLSGILLALVLVVVASAANRMWLYQAEYGLTVLRVHVLAFEFWLAGALVWMAATVLVGRAERFASGVVAWGLIATLGLQLPNLEGGIVDHNVAIAQAGKKVDLQYLFELSADAAPALVRAAIASSLAPPERQTVAKMLLSRYGTDAPTDWRGWNASQAGARAIVRDNRQALEQVAGLPAAIPVQAGPREISRGPAPHAATGR